MTAAAAPAKADQKCRAEIHLACEAEQQIPGHGEDSRVVRDSQQAKHVTRRVDR